MPTINLLSSKIYNRISAGEVVERPSSVVKELVENSIDAGADKITVEIQNGGISSIIITDNGIGIEKSELKKALLPHATSKISNVSDLDNICSLGFRGEALASIASVSKIKILSKPNKQDFGAEISAEGGIIAEIIDAPSAEGTEITVKNLFFNTPVRAKFLKSERSEESEITSVITKFILGNPNISIKYIADGKTILQSYGDGFESALVKVYGASVVGDCFNIDTEKNGIKISGYVGKHYFTKSNRSYQTVFVNGRYIVNQTISSAISNAYGAYLMKRQYPFYVLSINMPSETVDVNVHPNKTDVRFLNNQIVYGTIYSVVSKMLDGSSEALNIVSKENVLKSQFNIDEINNDYVRHNALNQSKSFILNDSGSSQIQPPIIELKNEEGVDIFAENKAYIEKIERERAEALSKMDTQEEIKLDRNLTLVGQALNTFLIFEDGIDVYFIDQHAAHERILFDKFNEEIKLNDISTQPLLIPYIIDLNSYEFDFIQGKFELLQSLGFDVAEFGNTSIKISSVPTIVAEINIKTFFNSLLSDLDGLKNITLNDVLIEKIAQKACKSAIKSGDKLSENEISALMNTLKGNLGLKCPHGRPIAVKISRTEIDKWFKRIV